MTENEIPPSTSSVIGFRTAMLLFSLLLAGDCVLLHGNIRIVMALVIVGLMAKTLVHHLRARIE